MKHIRSLLLSMIFCLTATGSHAALLDRSQTLRDAGTRAIAAHQIDAAIRLFQQAMVANPKAVDNYVALAKAEIARGNTERAGRYFNTALELDPIDRSALLGDGLLALAQDAPDRARARLDRLALSCGTCPEAEQLRAAIPAP